MASNLALPLPRFVFRPLTAAVVAVVHVYLSVTHLSPLFGGDVQWEHIWKGSGALAGAYVFAALASNKLAAIRRAASLRQRATRRAFDTASPPT
jgi:hypothetical protein